MKLMKLSRLRINRRNNSGIILIIVLWVLVILTMLAMSLGRKSSVELSLAKHAVGSLKSKYLAWAGLIYAIDQIRQDSDDEDSSKVDTLYYCARPITQTGSPEEIFKEIRLESGTFDVYFGQREKEGLSVEERYGFRDEESKINVNAITLQNYKVLSSLIEILGFDTTTAETVASSVVDWIDQDNNVANTNYGAEDDYYQSLLKPYHVKNAPFNSKEELLLVKGVSEEVYKRLKEYITIFPIDKGALRVNFDTASGEVLKAVTRSLSGGATNTDLSDADLLVEKMIEYRNGEDGLEWTSDDRQIEYNEISLNAKEKILSLVTNQYRTKQSNFIRVNVRGVDESLDVSSRIEAVIERDTLAVVAWQRH